VGTLRVLLRHVDKPGKVRGFAVFNFKKKSLAPVEIPIEVKRLTWCKAQRCTPD